MKIIGILAILFIALGASGKRWSKVDDPRRILDGEIEFNFDKLLTSAKVNEPWIGSYWRNNLGGLARRYKDNEFKATINSSYDSNTDDQLEVYELLRNIYFPSSLESFLDELESGDILKYDGEELYSNFLSNIPKWKSEYNRTPLDEIKSSKIAKLSPVEKYDLLLGDKNLTLTKSSWFDNDRRSKRNGSNSGAHVPEWMGYCNGLAVASSVIRESKKTVYAYSPDGFIIPFFPTDLKALASLQWSNKRIMEGDVVKKSKLGIKSAGRRCELKSENQGGGEDLDKCLDDTNPATFHLALTNRLGRENGTFIVDTNQWYQVWNYAVFEYSFTSKNIRMDQFSNIEIDKDTDSIVRIEMSFKIPNFGEPGRTREKSQVKKSIYFLELEHKKENGKMVRNIIGGFWDNQAVDNVRPDFLWRVDPNVSSEAYSFKEQDIMKNEDLEKWEVKNGKIPESLRELGESSSQNFDVLGSIMIPLLEASY